MFDGLLKINPPKRVEILPVISNNAQNKEPPPSSNRRILKKRVNLLNQSRTEKITLFNNHSSPKSNKKIKTTAVIKYRAERSAIFGVSVLLIKHLVLWSIKLIFIIQK